VFEPADAQWRGIGVIPHSGLNLRSEFSSWDSRILFAVETEGPDAEKGCACGEVLKGMIEPKECPLFGVKCKPEHPIGPCMVSGEGSCAAAYKYGGTIP
jgi:hydrogenase expression/formation protein HypD